MSQQESLQSRSNAVSSPHVVYKVVLTGGPCGGKSTVQVRLSTWFENLGWKVYRVPETATLLLGGGVRFDELNEHTIADFQENLLKTLLQIEQVYFDLSQNCPKPCLIICDRGAMDPSAFIDAGTWDRILAKIGKNNVQLRDSRYDQIIHLVTAAIGAEEFYSLENNAARTEGLELARKLDAKAGRAWLGHPYYDVIDNSSDFEEKCRRCLSAVSARLGIDIGDRLMPQSKRLKFLVRALPSNEKFGEFQDFDVIQNYLKSPDDNIQERLRKRGQNSHYTYMVSRRTSLSDGSVLETRRQINDREYQDLLLQADRTRFTAYKLRRCFIWNHQYFQMDVYQEPCHERCRGLILMETYSAKESNARSLPPFVDVVKDVTDDVCYSMYNLTLM
ncbi:TRPL translocation defect protein 14-like isoform X2 [Corticium candelabrum]|uniref:TRPL translocation defect protein 14-like isoform X2 n=1 Tax=Corticium candelabrum TaxID=121492 RepID=UPI002E25C944|nr:TRPL translocation defect protein 14-like isoform X2 [Corticium candelabrum]